MSLWDLCILLILLNHSLVLGLVPTYYAALGDSYATGNGAGSITSLLCGRFSGAYPVLVADRLALAFKNLACAGAFTSTVLLIQVPWVGNSDVVSVQVGGNQVDFFNTLNSCVVQWFPLTSCDREILRAKRIIESANFIETYDNFVYETKHRLGSDTTLLVLGYARFFNDETDLCDNISFSRTNPSSFLTKAKRRALNELITILNTVIQAAAETHGALYIDIDPAFEGHRFCEEGVLEPLNSPSWFFRDTGASSHDALTSRADQTAISNPSEGFLELTRTFHPTIEGHAAIADIMVDTLLHIFTQREISPLE